MIIQVFFFSHLDYCNALFTCNQPSMQNKAIQNIDPCILIKTTQTLASFHCLPVKFRIDSKTVTQHSTAVKYIT